MDQQADAEKAREAGLRCMAQRQGLMLRKSPRRDPRALEQGGYWLVDANTKILLAGGEQGLSLDGVRDALER